MEKRKCSMCREAKELKYFRFSRTLNKYISYCKECEKFYNRQYQRIIRARKKDLNDGDK